MGIYVVKAAIMLTAEIRRQIPVGANSPLKPTSASWMAFPPTPEKRSRRVCEEGCPSRSRRNLDAWCTAITSGVTLKRPSKRDMSVGDWRGAVCYATKGWCYWDAICFNESVIAKPHFCIEMYRQQANSTMWAPMSTRFSAGELLLFTRTDQKQNNRIEVLWCVVMNKWRD